MLMAVKSQQRKCINTRQPGWKKHSVFGSLTSTQKKSDPVLYWLKYSLTKGTTVLNVNRSEFIFLLNQKSFNKNNKTLVDK